MQYIIQYRALWVGILIWALSVNGLCAQQTELAVTLQQAIEMAQQHSTEAQAARHRYHSAYWNYRFFRAGYLPELTLASSPNLNKQISKVTQPDGSILFRRQNQFTANMDLKLNQAVSFTGGNFFLTTSTQRMEEFENNIIAWKSQLVSAGYEQSLIGYNAFKWNKRIEPLRYREARKSYVETVELIASRAGTLFFGLALAQANLDIATFNYVAADTLYMLARGRYDIGIINENEMLQLEINRLSEETSMMNARMELDNQMQTVRSFLGVEHNVTLKAVIRDTVPHFDIPIEKALALAYENSPDPDSYQRKILESKRDLAAAKANKGLKADLYMQFGLSQTGNNFEETFKDPINQQYVGIGIRIPVLDWGKGRGRVRLAASNAELVNTQMQQAIKDFELNVSKMVRQFNIQYQRVTVAAKTDIIAGRRYDVARKLYMLGKSTVLDLNAAIREKDNARRSHINAISNYWSLYYGLRSMTQYDFLTNQSLADMLPPL
ncbi:MAG: TolC family protein [Marinifilaceae bacterium]